MIFNLPSNSILNSQQPQTKCQTTLDHILQDIIKTGDYETALLVDRDGQAIAAVPFDKTTNIRAEMSMLLQDTITQIHLHLRLDHINELSMVADDGSRFICRFFHTNSGQSLSLIVITSKDRPYRHITNHAVGRIKQVCETITSEQSGRFSPLSADLQLNSRRN